MCEFYGNFLFEAGSKDTDIKYIFFSSQFFLNWDVFFRKILEYLENIA